MPLSINVPRTIGGQDTGKDWFGLVVSESASGHEGLEEGTVRIIVGVPITVRHREMKLSDGKYVKISTSVVRDA